MTYALVNGDRVVDMRDSLEDVPEHKRDGWREVPPRPEIDSRLGSVSGPVVDGEGLAWVGGTISLAEAKRKFTQMIDDAAEAQRLKYITTGAGQALEYQRVAEEARRYLETAVGEFPMLQASVDAGEAFELSDAAELVSSRDAAWQAVGAEIRRVRLTAKIALDEAETVEAVAASFDNIVWP